MNCSNNLKTAPAFFTLLAYTLVVTQVPTIGSEKGANTDEPIDVSSFDHTEHRDGITQSSMNVLDSNGNIREQAMRYIIRDNVSVSGCQSECFINFAFGGQIILAKRNSDGLFSDRPFILPQSSDSIGQSSVHINPTTRISSIMIGKHSFLGMFDRGTGNVALGSEEPNAFLSNREVDQRVGAFDGGGIDTNDCPTSTVIVDDSCTVTENRNRYCWTINKYDCNGVEIDQTRGCSTLPNSPGISCRVGG